MRPPRALLRLGGGSRCQLLCHHGVETWAAGLLQSLPSYGPCVRAITLLVTGPVALNLAALQLLSGSCCRAAPTGQARRLGRLWAAGAGPAAAQALCPTSAAAGQAPPRALCTQPTSHQQRRLASRTLQPHTAHAAAAASSSTIQAAAVVPLVVVVVVIFGLLIPPSQRQFPARNTLDQSVQAPPSPPLPLPPHPHGPHPDKGMPYICGQVEGSWWGGSPNAHPLASITTLSNKRGRGCLNRRWMRPQRAHSWRFLHKNLATSAQSGTGQQRWSHSWRLWLSG
mmetsp:Transcript_21973/g.60845  ORF Transcript_21973/g.60845 Transcript_21973/m.60845 type:complete len:283 (+) Transcript_21973:162-1010(+)